MKIISTFVCSFFKIKFTFCEWMYEHIVLHENQIWLIYFQQIILQNLYVWIDWIVMLFELKIPFQHIQIWSFRKAVKFSKSFSRHYFELFFLWDPFALCRDSIFVQKWKMIIFIPYSPRRLQRIRLIKWFYFIDQFFSVHVSVFNLIFLMNSDVNLKCLKIFQ